MSDTLDRLKNIVGTANLVEYPDFSSSSAGFKAAETKLTPDYLVKPENSDQVLEIVKLANDLSFPLIPVSSTGPHMTGGANPEVPGAVIVDLSGMKKILKIDRRYRLALIEPGVTWEELTAEAAKAGLRVAVPLLPKKGKSVIASLLDREPIMSPKYQWSMTEPLRSMEIILGTGERVFSGMGGHRGEKDSDWENGTIPLTNAGPHQLDFIRLLSAAQGTMGIVTWASVKLETAIKEEKPLFVEGSSLDELSDFLYKTLKFRFGDEVCVFNKKALSSILADDSKDMKSIESKTAQWTALMDIRWGALRAKEKIAVQEADVADIAQEFGLNTVNTVAGLPGITVSKKILSVDGENSWKTKATGAAKEIFFLSTLDKISDQLKKAAEVADRNGYSLSDCPIYLQPLHQGASLHCSIVLPITEESEEMAAVYNEMSEGLFAAGAFFSRPYGVWADIVYRTNTQHANMTNKMKDIFDPSNILNPGKLCF